MNVECLNFREFNMVYYAPVSIIFYEHSELEKNNRNCSFVK